MIRSLASFRVTRYALRGLPLLKEQDGGNLVEYSFIFLLLLVMLFGIAGFGHALYAYHFVSHAAREATRWASVNGSQCATDQSCTAPATVGNVQTYVNAIVPLGIDPNQVTVTPSWPSTAGICATTSNAPGCTVEVNVSYNFKFIFPLLGTAIYPLSSTSEMIISH